MCAITASAPRASSACGRLAMMRRGRQRNLRAVGGKEVRVLLRAAAAEAGEDERHHAVHVGVGGEVLGAEVVLGLERLAALPFLRHQRALALLLDGRIGDRPLGAVRAGEDDRRRPAVDGAAEDVGEPRLGRLAVADERVHLELLPLAEPAATRPRRETRCRPRRRAAASPDRRRCAASTARPGACAAASRLSRSRRLSARTRRSPRPCRSAGGRPPTADRTAPGTRTGSAAASRPSAGSRAHRGADVTGAASDTPLVAAQLPAVCPGRTPAFPSNTLNSFSSFTWLLRQSSSGFSASRIAGSTSDGSSTAHPVCVRSIGSSTVPSTASARLRAERASTGPESPPMWRRLSSVRRGWVAPVSAMTPIGIGIRSTTPAPPAGVIRAVLARRRPPARACAPPAGRRWRCGRR